MPKDGFSTLLVGWTGAVCDCGIDEGHTGISNAYTLTKITRNVSGHLFGALEYLAAFGIMLSLSLYIYVQPHLTHPITPPTPPPVKNSKGLYIYIYYCGIR